jgi:DNA primase
MLRLAWTFGRDSQHYRVRCLARLCPFHAKDRPSLKMKPEKYLKHCFGAGGAEN